MKNILNKILVVLIVLGAIVTNAPAQAAAGAAQACPSQHQAVEAACKTGDPCGAACKAAHKQMKACKTAHGIVGGHNGGGHKSPCGKTLSGTSTTTPLSLPSR